MRECVQDERTERENREPSLISSGMASRSVKGGAKCDWRMLFHPNRGHWSGGALKILLRSEHLVGDKVFMYLPF